MEQKKLSGAKSPKATKPIQAPSGKTDTKLKKQDRAHQPLERINFIIMGCAGAAIVLGFLLMLGSGSTTARTSPARQNAVMRANWKIYFTLLDPLFAKFLYIIPHRSIFDKLYIV